MWVKICGVHSLAMAEEVIACQPDAIGLNFYSRSPRVVERETAASIVSILPTAIDGIGLFVNESVEQVVSICRDCNLNIVQLHGDEPPEFVADLLNRQPELRVIRVYRLGTHGFGKLEEDIRRCRELDVLPWRYLVDAYDPDQYGGSGQTVSWSDVAAWRGKQSSPPLILAGGLVPGNVAEAIKAVDPWGVDVASGVESSPGVKDKNLVCSFVANARNSK